MALPSQITDREYQKFTDISGLPAIRVDVVRTVGGGGGGGSSATEYTDDGSFTVASDKGNAIGGIFTTDTIDVGDYGVFKINADRELATTIENAPSVKLQDGSGTSITSTLVGSDQGLDVQILNASSIGSGSQYADGTTVASQVGNIILGTDGTDLQFLSVHTDGALKVKSIADTVDTNVTNSTLAVTKSGTWNVGLNTGSNVIGKVKVTDGSDELAITATGQVSVDTVDTVTTITNDIGSKTKDGSGTSITSTLVGSDQGLDVNLVNSTIAVTTDEANDSIQVYGYDGSANQAIKTDSSGNLQIDVLTQPTLSESTDDILVYGNDGSINRKLKTDTSGNLQVDLASSLPTGTNLIGDIGTISTITNNVDVDLHDGVGGSITSTTVGFNTGIDVNIVGGTTAGSQYEDGDVVVSGQDGTIAMGTDGSNLQFLSTNSSGRLQVDIISGGGSNDSVITDDSAFTAASDKLTVTGGFYTTDQVDVGDVGAFKINADRELAVFLGESLPAGSNLIGAVTQSGTWDINDISGTISLPTGAATATKQLADGHNVTVDNGSGVSAVNIQDGGNSITIDATSLPLPSGAATEATLSDIETNTDALAGVTSTGTALDVNVASGTIIANIEGDYVDDSAFAVGSDKGLMVGGFFTTDTVDSGDFGAFKINADRELGVFLGESIPTGSNTIGAVTQSGTWDINDISGTISLPTGAATEATLSSIDTDTSTIATKVTDIETNTDALATVTKTTVGADTGLDVNVIKGINVEVDLDAADDSVLVYGYDGSSNQKIKTDSSGNVQVDVVASLPTGTNSIGDIANITNTVSVDDNGGSLTVDNSTLSVVGGGTEATAQRVTIANNSTGVLSVDDNGGSLTVDGTVAATQSGAWTISSRGTRTPYTEESAGLPPNNIAWNSATSGPILTKFRVLGITCKFAGIPTANDFKVSLNSPAAPLTNITYWEVNPGTLGLTDISWHPDGEIIIDGTIGESLDIIWTNAVAQVDWGLRVVVEEVTP